MEATEESRTAGAVLVVDDETDLLEVFSSALQPFFTVVTARSVREAEDWMGRRAFKVLVCDQRMPGGEGLEFLVRMRTQFPRTQRVLVTGYVKPSVLLRAMEDAALFRYLAKPVAVPEFIRVVREASAVHDEQVAGAG